nr:hypothetical protein [Angustibacter aerolatus]
MRNLNRWPVSPDLSQTGRAAAVSDGMRTRGCTMDVGGEPRGSSTEHGVEQGSLDRALIVRTAVEYVDAHGVADLSMRRLGQQARRRGHVAVPLRRRPRGPARRRRHRGHDRRRPRPARAARPGRRLAGVPAAHGAPGARRRARAPQGLPPGGDPQPRRALAAPAAAHAVDRRDVPRGADQPRRRRRDGGAHVPHVLQASCSVTCCSPSRRSAHRPRRPRSRSSSGRRRPSPTTTATRCPTRPRPRSGCPGCPTCSASSRCSPRTAPPRSSRSRSTRCCSASSLLVP